jgi:hypothetical protein
MKLDESAIVLRPRTIAEVMDLACRFGAVHARLYLRTSAATLLPCFALCLALRHALGWSWLSTWLAAAALATVAQGAFTVLVGRLLFSEALTTREVLSAFVRRLPSYLGALAVSRALLAASCLPLFLPLPFAWTLMLFQHEASLLEGAGPIASARRSARFIKGHGGTAFQLLLLLLLAQVAFIGAAEIFGDGLLDGLLQLGRPFGSLLHDGGTPFALLGFFASIPYVATARFLEYTDIRTRADGWDVQVRFMAIAAKGTSGADPVPASSRTAHSRAASNEAEPKAARGPARRRSAA